jgi:outer membrane murein-binding lipoprotein Lpp
VRTFLIPTILGSGTMRDPRRAKYLLELRDAGQLTRLTCQDAGEFMLCEVGGADKVLDGIAALPDVQELSDTIDALDVSVKARAAEFYSAKFGTSTATTGKELIATLKKSIATRQRGADISDAVGAAIRGI